MGRGTGSLTTDAAVSAREITRRFGDVVALDGVSLDVARGAFVSLLGPSGCGKTTLLRIIAGLDRQDSGEVWVAGSEISKRPPHKRPVNLVFQRYALFPHKTVAENVSFSLTLKRVPRAEVRARVDAMLELVHLPGFGDRHIDQLSGGQAQRVALARALIDDPPVLLLDEPLAALDLKLRQAMHIELREIQRRVGSTFVYVTHDQEEALVMSDRVVLMNAGRIEQEGTPLDVYHRPRTLFASTFLGEANLVRGRARAEGVSIVVDAEGIRLVLEDAASARVDGEVWVCLRPERIEIAHLDAGSNAADANTLRGRVVSRIFLGSVIRYTVAGESQQLLVETPTESDAPPFDEGGDVLLSWGTKDCVLLEEAAT